MATKSEFAEKVLHDLRRRKEQMAAARYTGNSHSTSRDANAHAGRFSRGSQQIKSIESDSCSSNRSFHIQESAGEVAKMNSSGNNTILSFLHRLTSSQKHHPSKDAEKFNQIQRAYQQETANQNQSVKQPSQTSNLVSHKRSSSCSDFAPQSANLELKNQSNSSKSGAGKGRLSNVIAKLMGLDELPQNADASKRKEGAVLKKNENSANPKTADSVNEKNMQSKNVKPTQETKAQLIENKTLDRILLNNQQKPKDIFEVTGDNNQANKKEQHLMKQKLQVNKLKGRQAEPAISQTVRNKAPGLLEKQFLVNQASHGKTNITKSPTGIPQKSLSNSVYPQVPAKDGSFENRNMNQNALPKKLASRTREGVGTHTLVQKKPSAEKKENYFQIHKKGDLRKIDGSSRKRTPQHMERSLGKQSAIFKVTKQDMEKHTGIERKLSQDKSKEAKQNVTRVHKSEVSSKPLSSSQELHGETKESSYSAGENDGQNPEAPISSGNQKDIALELDEIPIVQQRDIELTESEKHFKDLLVTSQLFLNTIQALFKLNIPISILETNDPSSKNSEFKLKLHCSYEVVKRKARRQKLLNHPYAKISTGCIKVRSLDDLIKQLCRGFEMLSSYGSRRSGNCHTAADYLHTMLEKDFENRNPDLNSMWEFGWDTMMSTSQEKDEIVRDVEKLLLNGLLDEIAFDLLQTSV